VPELAGRGYDGITVEHLLAMTGGFRFTSSRYPWSDGLMVARHPDLRRLILEGPPLVAAPGERFGYSDYSTVLLGMVLQRVTKMTLTGYFERVLWRPMGAEFGALWSMDHAGAGLEQAHCGLTARAIDLVKLGSIYLERGHWLGRQVIPAAWVDRSVSPPGADVPGLSEEQRASGTYYALGWWGQRCSDGSDPFYAHGMNGQIVFVHPGKRLVIARFGQRAGEVPGGWPGLLRAMAEDEA
jgi:CubicO group peptidase (beta-lactamase class C family)